MGRNGDAQGGGRIEAGPGKGVLHFFGRFRVQKPNIGREPLADKRGDRRVVFQGDPAAFVYPKHEAVIQRNRRPGAVPILYGEPHVAREAMGIPALQERDHVGGGQSLVEGDGNRAPGNEELARGLHVFHFEEPYQGKQGGKGRARHDGHRKARRDDAGQGPILFGEGIEGDSALGSYNFV